MSRRRPRVGRVVRSRFHLGFDPLLSEVISRRYDAEASTIITTNKPFSEWNQVFEGAACVSTMIDRLCHRVELVKLEGKSYRAKEAASLAKKKRAARTKTPSQEAEGDPLDVNNPCWRARRFRPRSRYCPPPPCTP